MLFSNEVPSLGAGSSVNTRGLHGLIELRVELTATDVSRSVFISQPTVSNQIPVAAAWQFDSVDVVFGTASTSGTLQIEKLTGTTAPGSGTVLLTGTVSLSGTANTVVSGTALSGDNASLKLAAGDRLGVKIAGTMTGLVGAVAIVRLKRILP